MILYGVEVAFAKLSKAGSDQFLVRNRRNQEVFVSTYDWILEEPGCLSFTPSSVTDSERTDKGERLTVDLFSLTSLVSEIFRFIPFPLLTFQFYRFLVVS